MKWTWAALGALALTLGGSAYTLDAREIAVVTLFGAPVKTVLEPGLYFRLPWPLHQVVRFDRRARLLEVEPTELLSRDKKNLVVEAFVLWRVADPQTFLEAVGTPEIAEARLSDAVVSRIGDGLGQKDFTELIAVSDAPRSFLSDALVADVAQDARARFGVEVLDVRLRHLGLPLQNEQSIYERMRAERLRIANAYRSEGEESATGIRARADREAAELLANAAREASSITARAEGVAAKRYAEAYRADPDLYRFLRSLDTYRAAIDDDTTLVLDAEGELFKALSEAP